MACPPAMAASTGDLSRPGGGQPFPASDVMGGVSAQGLAEPLFGAKVNGSREDESWKRFTDEALEKLLKNEYAGAYQQARLAEFSANLGL